MSKLLIGKKLDPESIYKASMDTTTRIELDKSCIKSIEECRKKVDDIVDRGDIVYGINTGFGSLSNLSIESDKLKALQANLIRSHSCGVGEPVKKEIVRAMMILRAHNISLGYSGVRKTVIDSILHFLNNDVTPLIPEKGSVGASGDLAPLAHLVLGLMGESDVFYKGERVRASAVLEKINAKPLELAAKEGLALINGTQFMTSHACIGLIEAENLLKHADLIAAMSVEAIMGSFSPFDERISKVRPHKGQLRVTKNLINLSKGSSITESHKDCKKVQDSYSFRCIPQVHGASRDAISYFRTIIETEINSVTDNPLIFDDRIISGGNFHGQPIAMATDFASIALSEIASISERRTDKILNPEFNSGLPAYLADDSGINSGFMIAQYAAASLVNENKVLSYPACVDNVPTSNNKEDHVSMGATSSRKFLKILDNVEQVLAIELMIAVDACEKRKPLKPSKQLERVVEIVREKVRPLSHDRALSDDMHNLKELIRTKKIISEVGVE